MTTAVDTSVLLDILTNDLRHASNSEAALADARASGRLVICESVVAELSWRCTVRGIGNLANTL